jgi:hypothetical protein
VTPPPLAGARTAFGAQFLGRRLINACDIVDAAPASGWSCATAQEPSHGNPQLGRMFLLWWKALSGSYLALTSASR